MGTAALLIVVWLGLGSGTTYQVPFSSAQLCEAARKEILDDAAKVRGSMPAGSPVMTSAVCLTVSAISR